MNESANNFGFYIWKKTQPLIFLLVILIVLYFFYYLFSDYLPLFVACTFIAYLLAPLVGTLEKKGIPRALAILLIYFTIALTLFILLSLLIPKIYTQFQQLQKDVPKITDSLKKQITSVEKKIENKLLKISNGKIKFSKLAPSSSSFNMMKKIGSNTLAKITAIFSTLPMIILIPILTFFFLNDSMTFKKTIISFIPNKYFEMSLMLISEIDKQIGRYIRGQILDCFIIGILYSIGLAILKVDYFLILGPIAGISNLIPYLGPTVGFVSSTIVAEVTAGTFSIFIALKILCLSLTVQMIDNLILGPTIVGKSVNLHPVVVMLALLVGANFLGFVGMLIAVPLVASLKVTIQVIRNYLHSYSWG